MRAILPRGANPLRIGLLGGSFDPAHAGHAHITREALKRFGLDEVWWLVSPGNPLKAEGPAPMARRVKQAAEVIDHPRVRISDFEARVGTRFTAETLAALIEHHPRHRFVWLMGADNLAQFHRWQDWRFIMARVPIGVFARPGDRIAARTAPAARIFRRDMIKPAEAHLLPFMPAPAWCFLNVPMRSESSTAIRSRGEWVR